MPANPQHPTVAQAPAEGVIGVQFAARLVVGGLVLEVVVVHQAHIGIQSGGVEVGHRQHALHGVVVVAEVDQVVLVVLAGRGQDEVDAGGDVQLVSGVKTNHRPQMGVTDAALVVVRAALDVQAHVIEWQQGVKAQVAAKHFLFRDPDETRYQRGNTQVDIGGLGTAIVAQAVGQVVADEQLAVGSRWRQDTHAIEFDAHGPGGDAAFGGLGMQGRSGQQRRQHSDCDAYHGTAPGWAAALPMLFRLQQTEAVAPPSPPRWRPG
ncbi:hypothetical protein D3C76_1131550 [compost metagenome]